jgi:hypothetical protein
MKRSAHRLRAIAKRILLVLSERARQRERLRIINDYADGVRRIFGEAFRELSNKAGGLEN